jgi:hypothetical protein
MENFVHHQAINACAHDIGLNCNLQNSYGQDDDVPTLLATELNVHAPQHSKWKANRVKAWFAETVVRSMTESMVAEVDPNGEMLGWMNDISAMLSPPVVEAKN